MENIITKRCTTCKTEKDISLFSWQKKSKGIRQPKCKECAASQSLDWYHRNKNDINGRRRKKYDPRKNKDVRIKSVYGITIEQYDAMFESQKGKCAICGSELDNGFFTHLDHDHDTGKIRALLCRNCNPGLGQFKHNIDLLKSAIAYLEKWL